MTEDIYTDDDVDQINAEYDANSADQDTQCQSPTAPRWGGDRTCLNCGWSHATTEETS